MRYTAGNYHSAQGSVNSNGCIMYDINASVSAMYIAVVMRSVLLLLIIVSINIKNVFDISNDSTTVVIMIKIVHSHCVYLIINVDCA